VESRSTVALAVFPSIPASHAELVDGPYCVALTTLMPDGQPQTTPVWCNREGECVLINTMHGFRKERNMRRDPRVTLLIYDVRNPLRNVEIRGVVEEMTEEGALEHLDQLTQLYMGKPDAHFFGDSVPTDLQATHIPVKIRIRPLHVRAEG
jgi:PPOX class probable F420-dependent enzyme